MILQPIHEVNHCHGKGPGHPCEGAASRSITPVNGQQYFLRFGELPTSGRSQNFGTGSIEAGVSAYSAEGQNGRFKVEAPQDGEWAYQDLLLRIRHVKSGADTLYVVEGDRIGWGGDGEPLLKKPRVVGTADPELLDVRP